MRYFNYGSWQTSTVRQSYPTQDRDGGGNRLGVLTNYVGSEIEYIQTTLKKGKWGWVPLGADPRKTGKAAGLVCVGQGTTSNPSTMWYQIGVDSGGHYFAELGYESFGRVGTILKRYTNIPVTESTDLKMVPNGNTVELYFGNTMRTLTWDKSSDNWKGGAGGPGFNWNNMEEVVWVNQQIETFWLGRSISSKASKMTLPGTAKKPFEFGPTELQEKPTRSRITGQMEQPKPETKSGDKFREPHKGKKNDNNFAYSSDGDKVKLWSETQFELAEQN